MTASCRASHRAYGDLIATRFPADIQKDLRVNSSRDAAKAALEQAGLRHEIVTYQGANHAFVNDTGQRYDAGAAARAYEKLTGWFATNLG
jgi:carboxymethylenebutenolidase